MRGLVGYVAAAVIAAMVATAWTLLQSDGQSLIASFHIPDSLAGMMPDLAIGMRRLIGYYNETGRPMTVLIDVPAGVLIFLVLNIPGAIFLWAAEGAWGKAPSWRTMKPLWGGLAYAVMAATFVMLCMNYGLPPFSSLHISPIGATLAALFAGAILGLTPPPEQRSDDYGYY